MPSIYENLSPRWVKSAGTVQRNKNLTYSLERKKKVCILFKYAYFSLMKKRMESMMEKVAGGEGNDIFN